MSLYRRGGIWWYDFTVDGGRYRGSTQQRSKTAAQKVEDRERERAKLGEVRAAITIYQAAHQWFAARGEAKKSARTIGQRIEIMLRCVGPSVLVSDIGAPEIEEAIQRRRVETTRQSKLPTNTTVNRDLIDTTLRPILRYAKKNLGQRVQDIEWNELKLPEPPPRERPFTTDEIQSWREALPHWHREVYDFTKRYGVRLAEAFFHPDSVDVETGRVFLRKRKNGRQHTIRLLEEDRADMAARVGRARAAGLDTVWFKEAPEGLEPIRRRGFQSASRDALDRAGIIDARPVHDLRHHAATTLMRKTGNLAAVKRLLGHENIQSTMRYAHLDDDDVFDAMRHAYDTEDGETPESIVKSKAGAGT